MLSQSILVIDDDAVLLEALRQSLAHRLADVRIDTCTSIEEAVDRYPVHAYGAILTDRLLPGLEASR